MRLCVLRCALWGLVAVVFLVRFGLRFVSGGCYM